MMQPPRLYQVNAFSRDRNGGNPAGVVLNADGLSVAQMRELADQSPAPDTAFVLSAIASDHEGRLRFLTPRQEAPFIGHATVAAQYVRARIAGDIRTPQRQLTGIGVVQIELLEVEDDWRISISQSAPALGATLSAPDRTEILAALGLSDDDLRSDCPLQRAGTKAPRLIIPLQSPRQLATLEPDFEALKALSPRMGVDGYFLFATEADVSTPATRARLFCPALGFPEDPVSGNTHAMLGVYLLHHGVYKPEQGRLNFRGHQGEFIGRAGIVHVEVSCTDRVAESVRILGDAVITSGPP